MDNRRWSKLQKELYLIIDPKINFQMHCAIYRIGQYGNSVPRFWITLEKEIIFDYPKQFVMSNQVMTYHVSDNDYRDVCYPYEGIYHIAGISDISDLIREYIDTPTSEILTKHFENDYWNLVDIFRAADRRIGQRRLKLLQNTTKSSVVQKILAIRIKSINKLYFHDSN